MDNILVTGSSGFIGHALVNKLWESGYQVTGLNSSQGDIASKNIVSDYDLLEFKHVFHLAAKTFVPDSWKTPSEFNRTNVLGTSNILDLCRKHGIPLTYASAYVYGIPDNLLIKEIDSVNPNNPYTLSKFLAEKLCEHYADYYNLNITVLRPFNAFGPGQNEKFLIPSIISQLRNDHIIIKDLEPRRDYVFIDDIVDALFKSLKAPDGYNVYNIGSGYSLSVSEVIDIILKAEGKQLPVHCMEQPRNNELLDVYADIEKAKNDLGWVPIVTFKEGINKILSGNNT